MSLLLTGEQHVLRSGDAEAVVVEVGGGLRTSRAGGRDIVDGYGEREMAADAREHVLVPWPDRWPDRAPPGAGAARPWSRCPARPTGCRPGGRPASGVGGVDDVDPAHPPALDRLAGSGATPSERDPCAAALPLSRTGARSTGDLGRGRRTPAGGP